MSRIQLSINVADFDAAVAFYSRLSSARLAATGLSTEPEPGATCCYARQDKVWVRDPDAVPWEYYTVLEHIETP
jgi:catechol 2,3-dioxygenase-like lactoylglutathione lyase family enzyme